MLNFTPNKIEFVDNKYNTYIYQVEEFSKISNGLVILLKNFDNPIPLLIHEETNPQHIEELLNEFIFSQVQLKPLIVIHQEEKLQTLIDQSIDQAQLIKEVKEGNITHRLYQIEKRESIDALTFLFNKLPTLCIADGHHRYAALSGYFQSAQDFSSFSSGILSVLFHTKKIRTRNCLAIIRQQNINSDQFLTKLEQDFNCEKLDQKKLPSKKNELILKLHNSYYALAPHIDLKGVNIDIFDRLICKKALSIADYSRHPLVQLFFSEDPLDLLGQKEIAFTDMCFLLSKEDPNEIIEHAKQNKLLKPNSTYFVPKLLENMIVHDLKNSHMPVTLAKDNQYDYSLCP